MANEMQKWLKHVCSYYESPALPLSYPGAKRGARLATERKSSIALFGIRIDELHDKHGFPCTSVRRSRGVGQPVFRRTGETLGSTRIVPATTHSPSPSFANRNLLVMLDDGHG